MRGITVVIRRVVAYHEVIPKIIVWPEVRFAVPPRAKFRLAVL